MKLKNLEVTNVGVLRHLDVKFSDGLTGIFGPQGSGKSTVVGCIYAAITNDFSRIADVKQNAVCQQAEGRESGLRLLLEANGSNISLSRTLAPNASNRLKNDSGLILTNDNKIKEEIVNIFGASRALLDNYVFVDQWEVRSLFKASASQRSEALALLCGTKFIDTCYTAVSKMRDADTELLYEGMEDVTRLRSELAEYKTLLVKENKELLAITNKLLDKAELERLTKIAQASIDLEECRQEFRELNKKIKANIFEADALSQSIETLEAQLVKAEATEESARKSLELAKLSQGLYEASMSQWKAKVSLEDKIKEAEEDLSSPVPEVTASLSIKECDKEIAEINDEIVPYMAIVNHYQKLPNSLECPTCGAPLAELKAKYLEASTKVTPFLKRRLELTQIKSARQKQEEAVREDGLHKQRLLKVLEQLNKELDAMADITEPQLPDFNIEDVNKSFQDSVKALALTRAALSEASQKKAKITSTKEYLLEREKEIAAKLDCYPEDEKIATKARTAIEADQKNRQLAAASAARREEYARVVEARETALSRVEAIKIKAQKTRKWIDLLSKAAPILHKDGLPKAVHSKAMREVEGEINNTLEEFECPFRIKTGDNLSYIARFCNGTEVPAHRLSGGQQVVLSLAMRWAFNSLFASQIGLLTLDEPTAGLDERHLSLLQSTLSKLGAAARNKGCQVIIITHEKRLRDVFDQVIELNRPVL